MSARILLGFALLAAGCHSTARCRAGTLFVDLAGAAGADQLLVVVNVGDQTLAGDQPYSGQSGIEIDFPGGYPKGQTIEVTVTTRQGAIDLASGSVSSTLSAACERLSISLVSLVEAGVDLAQDQSAADLSASNNDLGAGPTDMASNADLVSVPPTWTPVTVAGMPPTAQHSIKMVYDSFRDQIVLFDSGKTWLWNGTTSTWMSPMPATSPGARTGYGMAYDSDRHVTVLFGGQTNTSLFEVWEWDGTNWANKTPSTTNPWDVQATAIAFHAARHRTVLFGGWSQSHNSSFGQTWEWDGTTWTKQTPTLSPSADSGHSLAYDSTRQMVVLAGSTAQGAATWEYDATGQWNKRMPATPPGSHVGIGLAYDSNRGVTVLFGGKASNSDLDDTWEWNGTNWALMATSGPTPRRALAMTYDSLRKRTFMFGGASGHSPTTPHNDVWSWQ